MTVSIKYDFHLKHSPERVWNALTQREAIARWLMPNDFEPRLGHKFTFRRPPIPKLNYDGITHCEVTELVPPKQLAYTFKGGNLDTLVSFRLEPEGTGTHLYFEHSGFNPDDPIQKFALDTMGGGWASLGDGLDKILSGS